MKSRKQRIIPLITSLLIFSALLSACGGGQEVDTVEAVSEPLEPFIPVVSATGIVVPAEWATLSIPNGGVVEEIYVEEGSTLQKDDLILELQGAEALIAALEAARLEQISAQQALDDLVENADIAAAQALKAVASAMEVLDDAEYDRTVLQEGNRASLETIRSAQAAVTIAENRMDSAKDRYDAAPGDRDEDTLKASTYQAYAAAKQAYDAAVRSYNWYTGAPDEIDQANLDADVALAEAQMANAEREYAKVKDGPDAEAVALAEARLASAKAQFTAAQDAVDEITLNAPFDGTVSEIYPNPNEWVAPGQPLALIADLNSLQVETTDLSEIDAAQVVVGDRAIVTFDALPDVTSTGTVVYISPKAAEGAGVNFKVVIVLDEIPADVRWGMTAFVDIEIEE